MRKKMVLVLMVSAFLVTMCRGYAEPVSTIEGMNCRPYTDYFQEGMSSTKGLECYYTCPAGTVGPLEFQADPSLSMTKADMDRLYCNISPPTFTPAAPAVTETPTAAALPTLAASPIVQATSTASIPLTGLDLLTGGVTMCDTGIDLISFRLVQPPPDLTGKTLTLQIAEQESMCYVNQVNPSLLTCTIPPNVTFPARVVASLGGAVTNDFTYDGLGCAQLTTPMPTTTP